MTPQIVRIGTRASKLALAQSGMMQRRIAAALGGEPDEVAPLVHIVTTGDRVQDRRLLEVGGKALFTKEIEEALLAGRIDLAVHSSKDMPTLLPEGLALSAFLPREDPRDAFIGKTAKSILELPRGATVGSSSLRRQALILRMRPDIKVVGFRGNVQTRLRKLHEGVADGTILALAGLNRLGLQGIVTDLMPMETFPTAPGQGAICIESRIGDFRVEEMLAAINHAPTAQALACERAFLAALDGSCRTPIAGHATIDGEGLAFAGLVIAPDGKRSHSVSSEGSVKEAAELGRAAGEKLRHDAGAHFFADWS